jgi:hypothetical protein
VTLRVIQWATERVPMDEPAIGGLSFKAPLMLLADGLGATIDDYVWEREVAVTDRPIDVKAGRIEAGTVSAQRFSYTAIHDEDDTDQGCLGTAMHAVHAIAPVCAAAPGHPHVP